MLTPSELESLLGEPGSISVTPRQSAPTSPGTVFGDDGSQSPTGLDREQRFALEAMHRQFAHELSHQLSRLLNQTVAAEFTAMHVTTVGDSRAAGPSTACSIELRFDQLAEPVQLEIESSALWPLVDRLLGGTGDDSVENPLRPLTEIELRLIARAAEAFVAAMQVTWQGVVPLTGRVVRLDTSVDRSVDANRSQAAVSIQFLMEPGQHHGGVTLTLGLADLLRLLDRLAAVEHSLPRMVGDGAGSADTDSPRPRELAATEAVLLLTETRMSDVEVSGLQVGDVILTDKPISGGMEFRLPDGTSRKASLGRWQNRKAASLQPDAIAPRPATEPQVPPVLDAGRDER